MCFCKKGLVEYFTKRMGTFVCGKEKSIMKTGTFLILNLGCKFKFNICNRTFVLLILQK